MTVVSNTSPLRYLIVVQQAELIERIYGRVIIPRAVETELVHPSAPEAVRQWIARPPAWVQIRSVSGPDPELVRLLDYGEAEAIQLSMDLGADFLLMDESLGRRVASARGLTVIGTLGILLESYRQRRIEEPLAVLAELRACRFRVSEQLSAEFERQVRRLAERE